MGTWNITAREEEGRQATEPWGLLFTKADALRKPHEWAHNKDAARCPEGGGWRDGDHDAGESVRGWEGCDLKRTVVKNKFLLWCRGMRRASFQC